MADQYALGWILASLLALIALFRVVAKGKREGGSSARIECVKSAVTSGWDSGSADSNADVVIVGAGVAGSALAYTLGKVNLQSPATLPYCSLSLSFPTSRCFHFFFPLLYCVIFTLASMGSGISNNVYSMVLWQFKRAVGPWLSYASYSDHFWNNQDISNSYFSWHSVLSYFKCCHPNLIFIRSAALQYHVENCYVC